MDFYTFFVFFSVIVTPDGEIKSFTKHVSECPTWEVVKELHVPRLDKGEIIDWGATCLETKLPLAKAPEDAIPADPPVLPLDTTVKGLKT